MDDTSSLIMALSPLELNINARLNSLITAVRSVLLRTHLTAEKVNLNVNDQMPGSQSLLQSTECCWLLMIKWFLGINLRM